MPASVENLFPRNSAATSAGPSRPRTISAPHDSTVTSAGPNRPRTMRPLPDSTAASVRPKPTPSNKPASVENLFPRSSAATPCGTNRNLQQENHSNFTVASPHSPNTMAPGRHHDIRRDLPPISGAALLPIADSRSARIPAGRTGVRRPGCRRFQSHTDPAPQACVVDRDQSPPWKSRSRRSLCCPTWQHFHFTTDLPQLTAFTSPFSRPGATRFSPHDRHAKPCLRSDWARR